MKKVALLAGLFAALATAGCDLAGSGKDVPAQIYVNSLSAAFAQTGHLRGQILFPSEYAQHSIRFDLDSITFVTHPDGRFRIANVPPGERTLAVRIKGYEPLKLTIQVHPGQEHALEPLRLKQARGLVLGRLVSDQGRSAEGVEVHLAPDDGVAITDADGIFQFLGVSVGAHAVMVRDSRFFAGNQHFILSANERRNLGNIRVYPQTRGDQRTARRPD